MSPLDVDPDDLRSAIRQTVVRAGFKALVELTDDLIVVGEAANGREAVALARSTRPDVVLMDIRIPVLDGLEATRKIASDPHLEAVRCSSSPRLRSASTPSRLSVWGQAVSF